MGIRCGDLHDEGDRVNQRPLPAGGTGLRALPQRAGRTEVPVYLVTRSPDPTGGGRARWVMRWKPALNALALPLRGTARENRSLIKTAGPTHR